MAVKNGLDSLQCLFQEAQFEQQDVSINDHLW